MNHRAQTNPAWIRSLYDANGSLQQRNSVPLVAAPKLNMLCKLDNEGHVEGSQCKKKIEQDGIIQTLSCLAK